MTPAGKVVVVHVACWLALTVAGTQSEKAVPFAKNVTVPLGAMGVNATPARVAVKVTEAFTVEGLAGDGAGVRLMVGLSLVMVYAAAPGTATE